MEAPIRSSPVAVLAREGWFGEEFAARKLCGTSGGVRDMSTGLQCDASHFLLAFLSKFASVEGTLGPYLRVEFANHFDGRSLLIDEVFTCLLRTRHRCSCCGSVVDSLARKPVFSLDVKNVEARTLKELWTSFFMERRVVCDCPVAGSGCSRGGVVHRPHDDDLRLLTFFVR